MRNHPNSIRYLQFRNALEYNIKKARSMDPGILRKFWNRGQPEAGGRAGGARDNGWLAGGLRELTHQPHLTGVPSGLNLIAHLPPSL